MDGDNRIYARHDNEGVVYRIFSSVFETPKDTDILIEGGISEYHAHVHLKYQSMDANGCYNYKIVNGLLVQRSEAEKLAEIAQRPPAPKTEIEIMRETLDALVLASLGG